VFWILMTALAGVCTGSFGLPMKLNKRWKWENTWGVYAIWVLLIVPWVIAFLTVPNLFGSYSRAGTRILFLVLLFGSCWGVGQIAFGKGLDYLGIGMGFSLQIGLIIVVGSLLPLFLKETDAIGKNKVLAIIGGVAEGRRPGRFRRKSQPAEREKDNPQGSDLLHHRRPVVSGVELRIRVRPAAYGNRNDSGRPQCRGGQCRPASMFVRSVLY
jgi:hypothetical protein